MHIRALGVMISVAALALATSRTLSAHCDTMDGPVIAAARAALDAGDVKPVLKWIPKESEPEIRAAFGRTLKVRAATPDGRELADAYFFETLVRVHRAGEGEPYTGLKPAGAEIDPAVAAADNALRNGSADPLVRMITQKIREEIRRRFERVSETRKSADESAEAGRQYVAAYVDLMRYLEQLDRAGDVRGHGNTER